MRPELIQIVTGFIGALCFGVLFNLKGRRLVAAAIGGLISWTGVVLLGLVISSEPLIYFLVSAGISLYCEIMARLLKTPATPMITTSLIPLIPGSSLYYTFASAFGNNMQGFGVRAVHTLKLAGALAIGIIVVLAASELVFGTKKDKGLDTDSMN